MRCIKRLNEKDIEVPRWHRRGTFVRRAEEKVSLARGLALQPFELVLPDLVAPDIGLIGAFHDPLKRLVVVTVGLRGIETFGPILDERIEIIGFLEVQVILAVVRVGRDELAADGFMDFPQNRLHLGE